FSPSGGWPSRTSGTGADAEGVHRMPGISPRANARSRTPSPRRCSEVKCMVVPFGSAPERRSRDDLTPHRDPGGEHPCRCCVHGYHLLVLWHGLRKANGVRQGRPTGLWAVGPTCRPPLCRRPSGSVIGLGPRPVAGRARRCRGEAPGAVLGAVVGDAGLRPAGGPRAPGLGGAAARPPGGGGGVRRPAGEDVPRHTGAGGRTCLSLSRTVKRFRWLS